MMDSFIEAHNPVPPISLAKQRVAPNSQISRHQTVVERVHPDTGIAQRAGTLGHNLHVSKYSCRNFPLINKLPRRQHHSDPLLLCGSYEPSTTQFTVTNIT